MDMLYYFSGADHHIAVTTDPAGANLPPVFGPWRWAHAVPANDPRVEQGMGKGTRRDIARQVYSISRIVVTFEPSTTMPETR